jgi:ubiquinone/menaquinone biosynthesis C-methylase UbiE
MASESLAFDRAADFYDETRGFPPGTEQPVAELLCRVGNLTPASRALEIGIGTGRIALPLSEHIGAVYGIDLARPMMDRLRAKRDSQPVCVAEGDAAQLPFPAGAFDAVVAVHVFHLIAGWQAALGEIARVLRPGGVLISGYNDQGAQHPTDALLWEAFNKVVGDAQPPNVGIPRDRYDTFLEDEGWRPAGEAQSYPLGDESHAPASFLKHLAQRSWSSLWRVPDDALAAGIAAVRAALAAHQIDPEQTYGVPRSFVARAFLPPKR